MASLNDLGFLRAKTFWLCFFGSLGFALLLFFADKDRNDSSGAILGVLIVSVVSMLSIIHLKVARLVSQLRSLKKQVRASEVVNGSVENLLWPDGTKSASVVAHLEKKVTDLERAVTDLERAVSTTVNYLWPLGLKQTSRLARELKPINDAIIDIRNLGPSSAWQDLRASGLAGKFDSAVAAEMVALRERIDALEDYLEALQISIFIEKNDG